MDNSRHKNQEEANAGGDESTSSFFNSDTELGRLDLGGLLSGEFTNIWPLNKSASGAVDLYSATRYGRRFALKALNERYAEDPIMAMALVKEFEIGMSLEHPNIRRTLGFESVGKLGNAIVLEYVDGVTLGELISSRALTAAMARKIVVQIADALSYLHSHGIVHRDLKPSNIMISHSGGTVKIIDFSLSDSPDFIVLKNPAGSRKYMAPEQLAPDSPHATPSSDIYSLGVLMGELAEASSDRALASLATRLADPDTQRRPASIDEIDLLSERPTVMERLSAILSSATLTRVMIFVSVALIAAIIILSNR